MVKPVQPSATEPSGAGSVVLYVTPVVPQAGGNGLAMRAGMILEALAALAEVHLFVVPLAGRDGTCDFARRHAVRIGMLDLAAHIDPLAGLIARVRDNTERMRAMQAYPRPWLTRFCTGASARLVADWCQGVPLTAVHVMRLYLAPLVEGFLRQDAGRPFCLLDLDDDDALAYARLSTLERDGAIAARLAAEADKFRDLEARMLPRFDRTLVCSARDAARLAGEFGGESFAVVPNGCRLPPHLQAAPRPRTGPISLLFIGTLDYAANADAVRFLCNDIVPELRRLGGRQVRIDLIGGGADPAVQALASDPDIVIHGFVDDLAPWYAAADVAVVPIRGGGGTRIKILEAFAHRVPVVATRVGAEGIDAVDGAHLLLADEPAGFAAACLRLKNEPDTASRLIQQASVLLRQCHTPEAVGAALAAAYRT